MSVATKLTPKKRSKFLELLADNGNVTKAAEAVGVTRQAVYKTREQDEGFRALWDQAVDKAVDALEEEARRRAYHGVDEPQFYKGMECGYVRKYSDTLMIFLLKAHRPNKFRERIQLDGELKVPGVLVVPANPGSVADWQAEHGAGKDS